MATSEDWYIVKLPDGTCDILQTLKNPQDQDYWGKYPTLAEALAKRVGLIRAKKCKPK